MSIATAIRLKTVEVTVEGLTPLIFQGKGVMVHEAQNQNTKTKKHLPPEKEAELRAHWTGKGKSRELAVPSVMFYKSICKAAGDFKDPQKKARMMSYLVAGTISIREDMISLGTAKFETYIDWVRIPPRTGSMVQIGRPRLNKWKCKFTMDVDDEQYNVDMLLDIIRHAGRRIGIGANRPDLKGPNGKYTVTAFDVVPEK